MRNKQLFIAFMLCVLFLVQSAFAFDPSLKLLHSGRGRKTIEIEKQVIERLLKLTPEQEKAFKKIELAFRKETVALRNDQQIKQMELEAELGEDNPDTKKVESLIDEIAKLRATMQKKRISAHLQKRGLLDAEQRRIWENLRPWKGQFEPMGREFGLRECPLYFQRIIINEDEDEDER